MDFELKKRRKGRVNIWYANTGSRAGGGGEAGLIAGSYLDVVSGSFADNSFIIRDTVTPANNYSGELITNGRFNKFTYSRAGLATMTGSDGLIQWAPHNLYTYSAQSDDALWVKTAVTVAANSIASPDGTTTADSMLETTANDTHVIQNQITFDVATTYTVSRFAKTLGGRDFYFQVNNNSGAGGAAVAFFDLTNGVAKVGTDLVGGITNKSVAIQSMGNGWYRCSFTFTTPAADANIVYHGSTSSYAAETRSFVGDTAKGVYLWGAQANVGILQTYYPTTAAAFHGPRIHYNPSTLAILGYQHEGARANLALQSEVFDNASWTKAGAVITANNVVAPDGTLTADKAVIDASSNGVYQSITVALLTGQACVLSCWMRMDAPATLNMGINGAGDPGNNISQQINVTTEWQRFSYPFTVAADDSGLFCAVALTGTFNGAAPNIAAERTVYMWGAQLELGGAVSSYIPTTTIAVTRAADDGPYLTDAQFNSTAEGTLFAETSLAWLTGNFQTALGLSNTSEARLLAIGYEGSASARALSVDTGIQADMRPALVPVVDTFYSQAMAYAVNDFAVSLDGAAVVTDALGTIPGLREQLKIGMTGAGISNLTGTTRQFAFIGERVSNGAMQSLTT